MLRKPIKPPQGPLVLPFREYCALPLLLCNISTQGQNEEHVLRGPAPVLDDKLGFFPIHQTDLSVLEHPHRGYHHVRYSHALIRQCIIQEGRGVKVTGVSVGCAGTSLQVTRLYAWKNSLSTEYLSHPRGVESITGDISIELNRGSSNKKRHRQHSFMDIV